MSADRLSPSCTQTIGLTAAKAALLNCFLFLVVSPRRERDRSEDKHLRDEFWARVRHRHGECGLPCRLVFFVAHLITTVAVEVHPGRQKCVTFFFLSLFTVSWRFLDRLHVKAYASDQLLQRSLTKTLWFQSSGGIFPACPS